MCHSSSRFLNVSDPQLFIRSVDADLGKACNGSGPGRPYKESASLSYENDFGMGGTAGLLSLKAGVDFPSITLRGLLDFLVVSFRCSGKSLALETVAPLLIECLGRGGFSEADATVLALTSIWSLSDVLGAVTCLLLGDGEREEPIHDLLARLDKEPETDRDLTS